MRRTVTLLLLAGAFAAPASSAAAFPTAVFDNVCRYSVDAYWRTVPMVFQGTLVDGAGAELASGARLKAGDTVRLRGGKLSATLPEWILPFAYDAQMIPLGDSEIPIQAWLALEATNTVEGVRGPIPLTTVADAHVELTPNGVVDEERSTLTVVAASLPELTWTAAGGEVQVRQALGDGLPPVPVGRNGADVRVRGSLYVRATLSGDVRLDLDCLQGIGDASALGFIDWLPGTLGVFRVPGWTGTVDGAPLADPVEADVLPNQGPPRAGLGQRATLGGTVLRLQLTDEQREAWLGDATDASIGASLTVDGARSVEGSQVLPVTGTVSLDDTGPTVIVLGVPSSTWTAATDEGIDLRTARSLSLVATVGGQRRTLALTHVGTGDPYPFARILRSAASPTPTPTATATAVPTATPAATVAPVPHATPAPTVTPAPAPTVAVAVRSAKLKVASKRVAVRLRCGGGAACNGTVTLRSASKVKVGRKKGKRLVTLARSAKYRVAAGRTATVRLALSKDAKTLLKSRRSLRVRLTLKPASGKAVAKTLTLAR